MGVVKLAICDGLITFTWMFCVSGLGVWASIIASALNLDHHLVGPLPNLVIDTVLISLIVFFFTLLGQLLGGASFNPTASASFYAAGVGGVHDDLVSVGLRLPAQAAGAVGGAMAIMEFMPPQYKHMLVGPSLKVDQHTGAIAEGSSYTGPSMNPVNMGQLHRGRARYAQLNSGHDCPPPFLPSDLGWRLVLLNVWLI